MPSNNTLSPGALGTSAAHPPPISGVAISSPASASKSQGRAPEKRMEPPDNTIALKDGSIIILKAEDEIL